MVDGVRDVDVIFVTRDGTRSFVDWFDPVGHCYIQ